MNILEYRYAVLILAAGQSLRYGSAKQLAEIKGIPMIRHVVQQLFAPDLYRIVVVLGANTTLIRPVIADLDAEIVENPEWESGLSSSIHVGVSYLSGALPSLEGLVIVLGDQWKITRDQVKNLLETAALCQNMIVATDYDDNVGVPAFFSREKWGLLLSLKGDEGAKQILQSRSDIRVVEMPEARTDLDYAEDE